MGKKELNKKIIYFNLSGTTERIFENKDYLYDLFVNDSQLNAVLSDQKNLLKINSSDKKRYDLLLKKITYLIFLNIVFKFI